MGRPRKALGYFEGLISLRSQPKRQEKGRSWASRQDGQGDYKSRIFQHGYNFRYSFSEGNQVYRFGVHKIGSPLEHHSKLMLMAAWKKKTNICLLGFLPSFSMCIAYPLALPSPNTWKCPSLAQEGSVSQGASGEQDVMGSSSSPPSITLCDW